MQTTPLSSSTHPFRVIGPGEDAPQSPGTLDLRLERSAFGGGTHPTTASCLAALTHLPLAGLRVLDLGSGTGILGIAAVRLGARDALCVDVNPEAVESARRNAVANGVADRLDHLAGTAAALAGRRFDLVVANIGGELLLDEADHVAPLVGVGGRLLLSGLLHGYADDLGAAYARHGFRIVDRASPGGFCTLLMERG